MQGFADILITAVGFGLFAVLHSVLANRKLKQKIFLKWPELTTGYRIIYTLISVLTLAAWYFFSPFPGGILYEISFPLNLLFRMVQLAGLVGFLVSLKSINMMQFIGFSQLQDRNTNKKQQKLVSDGLYQWVRHPLYTSSMMILFFNPVMSNKLALINLLFGLYFWIGSIYEERNLVNEYGQPYVEYQQEVPRFIPKIPLF